MADGVDLLPDAILQVATETEERVWSQGGITDDREESLQHDPTDIGMNMLMHGTCTRQIHNYFSGLEQRKCCLLLAACKQRFASVRLVRNDGRDSGIEEGAMMKSSLDNNDSVSGLDAVEFQVFKNALKCAAFPVLGAPEPPSESTPIPGQSAGNHSGLLQNRRSDLSGPMLNIRDLSPASMHDSGVEEQEDAALVPTETLCELLRRAFRLTLEKFSHYEKIVIAHIDKKSPQKVLAEELGLQLIALENNENPYYNPKSFLNHRGYDQWQQWERLHITELLNKFWQLSLPLPSDRSTKMTMLHKQYSQLLEKLISYESPYRRHSELSAPHPTSQLSTASVRLLKEFGLRYGVGEQYRKIVYLSYLSLNFEPSVWFIHHVMMSLTSIMEAMPTKRSCLVMVKEEFSILDESLQLLEAKSSAAIAKMKTLYSQSNTRPLDGVEALIELLALTLKAKCYLLMNPEEQLGTRLYKIIHMTFPTAYERHKMMSQDELRHNKGDTKINPKLLNMMIGHIRAEVQDYKHNYQTAFHRYFNITVEAAQEFYKLFMADVTELLGQTKDSKSMSLKINKLMLSLAYRLHQLDQDWVHYITPQMQTWREPFLVQAQHWSVVLKLDMHKFITYAVSLDRYPRCELQWTGSLHSYHQRHTGRRTVSMSLTPSMNSAFTSPSSAQSTPHRGLYKPSTVSEDSHSPSPDPSKVPEFPVQFDSTPDMRSSFQEQRPYSDPVDISQSSLMKDSYIGDIARSLGHYDDHKLLTFTSLRQSSSLPNISAVYSEMTLKGNLDMDSGREENYNSDIEDACIGHMPHTFIQQHSIDSQAQEVTSYLASSEPRDDVLQERDRDSENSNTLTDDSHSHNGEFSYPPLEEVAVTSTMGNSQVAKVTVISDIAGNRGIIRPVVRKTSAITQQMSNNTSQNNNTLARASASSEKTTMSSNSHRSTSVSETKYGSTKRQTKKHAVGRPTIMHSDSITDSIGSNISFPQPRVCVSHDITVASMPISSSAVDVLVMLQRIVGIGKVLCRTLTPTKLGYESDQSAFSYQRDQDFPLPQLFTKPKQRLYDSFLSTIKNMVIVYADNMLCMDLCGTTQSIAKRLAGTRLIEYLQTQQKSGLIWGCRHDHTDRKNCFQYLEKKTQFLCDRHEPITEQMCTRINNVMFMSTCLDWYYRCLGNTFGVFAELTVRQHLAQSQSSINSIDMLRGDFIILDNYAYDPVKDESEVMETASQLCPSLASQDSEGKILVTSPVDGDRDHLMAVMRAMCRIMAYRLNLFVRDALPVLLTLKGAGVPIGPALSPITDFLANYTQALKGWLYESCYRRVLECLWIFIVQDFEEELHKMERLDSDSLNQGQLLLQALAHLLKFMNNQDESLRRELLLSQAADVSFKLSLYAMPLQQLVAIYRGLCIESSSSEVNSTDSQYQCILVVRQRLKHDLQTYKKGFSGAELIQWILGNLELFSSFDPGLCEGQVLYAREKARNIAQRLLDWRVIADIEGETVLGYWSPTQSYEYPDMTIHTQLPSQTTARDSDEDITPQATPCATPRPTGLRASIRALSRQSEMKSVTPGFTRSHLVQSQRSLLTDSNHQGTSKAIGTGSGFVNGHGAEGAGFEQQATGRLADVRQDGAVDGSQPVSLESELEDRFVFTGPSLGQNPETAFRQDSRSQDFDQYQMRGSPNSITSAVSGDSRSAIFFESSETFYSICPYIGDDQVLNWKNYELFNLVEECFQKKISEDYVLRIIHSRRKSDPRAKRFLQSAPLKVRELIKFYGANEEASVCVSS